MFRKSLSVASILPVALWGLEKSHWIPPPPELPPLKLWNAKLSGLRARVLHTAEVLTSCSCVLTPIGREKQSEVTYISNSILVTSASHSKQRQRNHFWWSNYFTWLGFSRYFITWTTESYGQFILPAALHFQRHYPRHTTIPVEHRLNHDLFIMLGFPDWKLKMKRDAVYLRGFRPRKHTWFLCDWVSQDPHMSTRFFLSGTAVAPKGW